ncbi:hydantoinase/oxoprolinase family protein [Amycolatopsis pithecellobii]|uniref:Hydantoinase/oxoprolinase family protein n=1 Tax=Amycolatopsis pithecellobii TaxID=664692 RepID=A0A6N7Z223_9PSEU|nr:hydantoinase/oxoprolinase family protein [Amycolatopsis pithecellobii]MTD53744.1 hydantoinase/oxoprolinase family protein [Amycolatopsis pithecellobii]
MKFVIGIDVGGTFTDAVVADTDGNIIGAKTPSTPDDYSRGVLTAVSDLAAVLEMDEREMLSNTAYIAHGTTASINALVTGNVEPVAFITTRGHGDSISIMNVEGRYLGLSAMALQDTLTTRKPAPLVPKSRIFEITERIDQAGDVVVPLNEDEVRDAVRGLQEMGVQAVAVSLLWSFQNPQHEHRVRDIIAEMAPETFVALSSDISPRIREFARSSTTIMSTALGPPLRRYLQPLDRELHERGLAGPLLIMQSSGGTIAADEAPASAITTVGSVLSGGVVGATRLAQQLGHRNVVTADVGGTTFLVGMVVDGEPVRAASTIINQHSINVPTIKVDAIGSGGGAIAWIDAGGNLRVGPQSAAAVPGPAAYDAGGTDPTVTDANIVLGIIDPNFFLGGKRQLQVELAERALLEKVGKPLGLDAEQAAAAVYEVQNAQTADLARKVVVEAGHDPRDFVMYAFGGSGPIHAAAIATELGISELVVPLGAAASGFSAFGLAASDVTVTAELSDPGTFPLNPANVQANYDTAAARVTGALERQGVQYQTVDIEREFDARYVSQMFEVTVNAPAGDVDEDTIKVMAENFASRYAELYGEGAAAAGAGYQAITYRVRGVGRLPFRPVLPPHAKADTTDASGAIKTRRRVFLDVTRGFEPTPIYDYDRLKAGHQFDGPAVIEAVTTTVTIPAERTARVDDYGNIRVSLTEENAQ